MWQEETIQSYFDAWVRKDAAALKSLISPDVLYVEADGPCYVGLGQVLRWFADWNQSGTVLEWTAKRFTHREDSTLVEWYFRCDIEHEETGFDGISVITFDDLNRIAGVHEFYARAELRYPYGPEPITDEADEAAMTSSAEFEDVKVLEYSHASSSHPLYRQQELEASGIGMSRFEQRMYHARKAGTLYGIRFQNEPRAQNKLVYCFRGRGLDYAVDLRKSSPTYLRWTCVEISADNNRQVYIPKGYGHAFLALEDNTCMVCCFDEPYDERYSRVLAWNEPAIGLALPVVQPLLGETDAAAPMLENCEVIL